MVVKKWFTLVAISGLSGLVASVTATACSVDATIPTAPADSGSDGKVDTPREAGPEDEEPKSDCPLPIEYKQSDIDTELKGTWAGPKQTIGACTTDELKAFTKNLSGADDATTIEQIGAGLGAGCKSCLFSTSADANWQLVVAIAGGEPTEGFINFGACHAVVNGDDACGKDYQYNQFCVNAACAKCSESDSSSCLDTVWSKDGACEAVNTSVEKTCTKLSLSESKCTNEAAGHAAVLCGPKVVTPPPDAGANDAGADADAN